VKEMTAERRAEVEAASAAAAPSGVPAT
jgi:hypothetical protein